MKALTPGNLPTKHRYLVSILILAFAVTGCANTMSRTASPKHDIHDLHPYGIEGEIIRGWGDSIGLERSKAIHAARLANLRTTYAKKIAEGETIRGYGLALSGGGPDGAYGAGLLKGWTESGTRPEFRIVTGISTGSIISLFAYLGPEYNGVLEEIYTSYTTDDLVKPTLLSALFGGPSLADTSGYRALIERYIDDDVVKALAREYEKRRLLIIGTTNLDASRPVVWNVGAIAATGHPQAKTLIQDIVQASSAIPVAFPPTLIPVTTRDGQTFDEMHVDGGATNQVILFSPEFSFKEVDADLGVPVERTMYIVINNKLEKPFKPVDPDALSIAGASLSSLIGGDASGDVYRLFAVAQRDDIDFNLIYIPLEFDKEPKEAFDPDYMRALFDLGYEHGRNGVEWRKFPPDYKPFP